MIISREKLVERIVVVGFILIISLLLLTNVLEPKNYNAIRHVRVLNVAYNAVGKSVDTVQELRNLLSMLKSYDMTIKQYHIAKYFAKENPEILTLTKKGWVIVK